jgi:guanine deaminase
MATQKLHFYIGTILNPLSDEKCQLIEDGCLVINSGKIEAVTTQAIAIKKYAKKMTARNSTTFSDSLILPGLFDMHFHWVQDDVREMPKDSLLEWLEKYTFPTEMKFVDKKYAQKRAKEFFKKLSSTGTIGGACYSSIHQGALEAAMKQVKGHFVIGNVLMNMYSPEQLTQTEKESLALTQKLIKKYQKRLCFTPRFAITTTPKVMKNGSRLADKAGCFKQTHLSETPAEIDFVLSIYRKFPGFEKVKSYTEIYHKTGMLGRNSLMGHGIHLGKEELKTLSSTKTSIIHCPTSNAPIEEYGLGSGLFDFKKIESNEISWALGSDIGGGPFLSMFDVMRSFIDQNKEKKVKGATCTKALYRMTLASAKIMKLDKKLGNLKPGKDATFIVVNSPKKGKSAEEILLNLISEHRLDRKNYDNVIQRTYLNGKLIFKR